MTIMNKLVNGFHDSTQRCVCGRGGVEMGEALLWEQNLGETLYSYYFL